MHARTPFLKQLRADTQKGGTATQNAGYPAPSGNVSFCSGNRIFKDLWFSKGEKFLPGVSAPWIPGELGPRMTRSSSSSLLGVNAVAPSCFSYSWSTSEGMAASSLPFRLVPTVLRR